MTCRLVVSGPVGKLLEGIRNPYLKEILINSLHTFLGMIFTLVIPQSVRKTPFAVLCHTNDFLPTLSVVLELEILVKPTIPALVCSDEGRLQL